MFYKKTLVVFMIKVNDSFSNVPVKILMRIAKDVSPLFSLLLERKETDNESIQKHMSNIAEIANTISHILLVDNVKNTFEEKEIFTNCINLYCDMLAKLPYDREISLSEAKNSIVNFILAVSKLDAPAPDAVFENHSNDVEMILTRSHIMVVLQNELDFYEKTHFIHEKDKLAVYGKYSKTDIAQMLTELIIHHGEEVIELLNIQNNNNILTKKSILKNQLTGIVKSMIGPAILYSLEQTRILRKVQQEKRDNIPEKQRTEKTKSAAYYEKEYFKMKNEGTKPPFVSMIERELPRFISHFYQIVSNQIENDQEERVTMK